MSSLITITEAAKILGLDRTTVWRWYDDKRLQPAMMIGKTRPLFDREYIERIAAARKAEQHAG